MAQRVNLNVTAQGYRPNMPTPQVDFNPQPNTNPIDAILSGYEKGKSLGLRQKQMRLAEQEEQRKREQLDLEKETQAIENIKNKSYFYGTPWFGALSQEDQNKIHRGYLKDLTIATKLDLDYENSKFEPADVPAAKAIGALFEDKTLSRNDKQSLSASIIANAQKNGATKDQLAELRDTAKLGLTNDNSYQWANLALRERGMNEKQDAKDQKMMSNNQALLSQAKRIIGKVDEALTQVGPMTVGVASKSRVIPGTPARNLDATLKTIKANLGFAELQAMRQASPTGGALGQIAVQELESLQATLANLEQDQSEEQLRQNLQQVRTHYENWMKTVEKSMAGSQTQQPNSDLSGLSDEELLRIVGGQ